jgi:hypothetical protein
MFELISLFLSFCLYRLLTLRKMPAITFGGEIKILFGYGIWYSIISLLFVLVLHFLK